MAERDAKKVAEGLTPSMRRDLIRLSRGEHYPGWGIFILIHEGLATFRKRWLIFGPKEVLLTRIGKQVRDYLRGEQ